MTSQDYYDSDRRLRELERKLDVIGKWVIVAISLSAGLAFAGVVDDLAPVPGASWPAVVALTAATTFVGWILRSDFFGRL